eukprot:scaffold232520_cov31-Tisochrysis_lutea.AAC.1
MDPYVEIWRAPRTIRNSLTSITTIGARMLTKGNSDANEKNIIEIEYLRCCAYSLSLGSSRDIALAPRGCNL